MLLQESKNTLNLALPMILGQLSQILLGLVDAYMVGKLGATPLAAVALANSIFSVIMLFGLGLAYALSPILANALSKGETKKAAIMLNNSLMLNMIAAVIIAATIFFGSNIVFYLNQPPEVSILAKPFLQVIGLSFIPFMVFMTYKQFSEGLEIVIPPLIAALLAVPLNIVLNYWLMNSNPGEITFYNGYMGAAYGTFFTRTAIMVGLMVFVMRKPVFKPFFPRDILPKPKKDIIIRLLKLGIPGGLQWTLEAGAFSVAAIMMGWIGTKSLAAHNIAINIAVLSFIVVSALAAASAILISKARGEKNYEKVTNIGKSSLVMGIGFMGVCGLILLLFSHAIAAFFIDDDEVVRIAAELLVIAAFFQIFDGAQAVGAGLLRGLEDVKIPTIMITIAYWVLAIPMGYVLAFRFQLNEAGIWYALSFGLLIVAVLLVKRFFYLSKKLG